MRWLFENFRFKLLALGLAVLLWGVAHSTSSIERGFDLPVVLEAVPETLVPTDRSTDAVNIRVKGSRAALRSLTVGELEYPVDLSGAKPGKAEREVDVTRLELPRGAQIVSRSPSRIEVTLEKRDTKGVRVRADLEGQPAPGYVVGQVVVEPPTVRITGARTEVLGLAEVLTETIDVSGADASVERRVRPNPRGRNVWPETDQEVTVRVEIEPVIQEGTESVAEEEQG